MTRAGPTVTEFLGPLKAPFLHTILLEPRSPDVLTIAVSVGGVFRSADGGETWRVCTAGMSPWRPDGARFHDVHLDVHKLAACPADPRASTK